MIDHKFNSFRGDPANQFRNHGARGSYMNSIIYIYRYAIVYIPLYIPLSVTNILK